MALVSISSGTDAFSLQDGLTALNAQTGQDPEGTPYELRLTCLDVPGTSFNLAAPLARLINSSSGLFTWILDRFGEPIQPWAPGMPYASAEGRDLVVRFKKGANWVGPVVEFIFSSFFFSLLLRYLATTPLGLVLAGLGIATLITLFGHWSFSRLVKGVVAAGSGFLLVFLALTFGDRLIHSGHTSTASA